MSNIIGIDLGTTNSCVAVVDGGQPRVLENAEGVRTTPSIVATKGAERYVGVTAKRQAVTNPTNTLYSVKRLIGRRFSDEEVQRDQKLLPYEIRKGEGDSVEVKMGDKWYKPAEISAMVLGKLKADAEAKLGSKVTEAIITVPAYFDDSQRQATKDAGEIAGLTVKRVINEPTAAALAYGFNKKKDEKIVVYDFGGGTFDISVLEVSEDTIEVKATGGDTHLGGDDVDQLIINFFVEEFKKDQGVDISKDQLALQRLKDAAEKAKHELSSTAQTDVNIPFLTADASGPKHFALAFTRAKLESLTKPLIDRSIELTRKAVSDAGLNVSDIHEVVMVGGQTRMPAIVEAVKALFGRDPHRDINPDEVVAIGAAIQGGIMGGDVRDVLLLDVTPLSLGIETLGGVATPMIEKNTTVPTSKSQVFSTAADNQPSVEIHIVQGERQFAKDNKSLGRFILDGVPPAPRGVPQIEVSFDIDANGILSVKAKDKGTGKEQSIRIEGSSGLSKEEKDRMIREAQEHAAEDMKKKEELDTRNAAETLAYTTEKMIADNKDKIVEADKGDLEGKIMAVKEALKGTDMTLIKSSADELGKKAQEVGGNLYKAGEAAKQEAPASGAQEATEKAEEKKE